MIKTKENPTAIKFFQDKIKKRETSISSKDLDKIKVDTTQPSQKFRNILLKKDFWGDWIIEIIDENIDLDGIPIEQNKKLITRIKALWENGKTEINFNELIELNIFTPAKSLNIQNFNLYSPGIGIRRSYYSISLIDKNKNIDGLWLDKMINTERILDVLKDFNINSKELTKISELDLNKLLEEHFKIYFENIKKGGTTDKGLIDLIVGDLVYGIELKLARELVKSADRAHRQIDRYMEKFGANFMVIIAGNEKDKKDKSVQELIKKIRNSKGAFYYLETND